MSLVRSKAREWGIDPARIGMVGFSAGGHLVGATATNFEKRTYDAIDDVDKVSCRPDFAVMLYSGYFKVKDRDELSPTIRVTAPFVRDKKVLQREAVGGSLGLQRTAYALVALLGVAWVASLGWGLTRLARTRGRGPSGLQGPRGRATTTVTPQAPAPAPG